MGPIRDANRVTDYAIPSHFCQIFNDHLDYLYTLSFLLTADPHKAEQCFVTGLENCLEGSPVFRRWGQSWAKRMVIKNAIRMISPSRIESNSPGSTCGLAEAPSSADNPAAAITKLQTFDRFVYVLSVLEKYSDRECSILLDCALEEIVRARTRALQQLSAVLRREAVEVAATN